MTTGTMMQTQSTASYDVEHDETDSRYYIRRDGARLYHTVGCHQGEAVAYIGEGRAEFVIDCDPSWLREFCAPRTVSHPAKTVRTNATSSPQTTQRIARLLAAQGQVQAILKALDLEAASWPEGTWSDETETRLQEKRAAGNALWGDQSRAADDYGHRLRAEQQLRDRLAFAETLLRRLVQ